MRKTTDAGDGEKRGEGGPPRGGAAPVARPKSRRRGPLCFTMKKKVALGGSFNPPTTAHVAIMRAAIEAVGADEGVFVPSSDAYVRRKMAKTGGRTLPERERAETLRRACAGDARLSVSEAEFGDDGKGNTYDTLAKARREDPDAEIYFVIGADKLRVLPRWRKREKLLAEFRFAVLRREGEDPEKTVAKDPTLSKGADRFTYVPTPRGVEGVSSSAARALADAKDWDGLGRIVHPYVLERMKALQGEGGAGAAGRGGDGAIRRFDGENRFLSNFHPARVTYGGVTYASAEAAFQAQKTTSEKKRLEFARLGPGEAKREGRRVALREDWEDVKDSVMEGVCRAKFGQNPELARKLLATGGAYLEETYDTGKTPDEDFLDECDAIAARGGDLSFVVPNESAKAETARKIEKWAVSRLARGGFAGRGETRARVVTFEELRADMDVEATGRDRAFDPEAWEKTFRADGRDGTDGRPGIEKA